jgi:ATP-binding cassette subfamily B protein
METDAQIREALRENTGNATVVLISHRINTLMQADQILVLEDGRISEAGTHDELVARDGLYRRVYQMQLGQTEGGAENG